MLQKYIFFVNIANLFCTIGRNFGYLGCLCLGVTAQFELTWHELHPQLQLGELRFFNCR